MTLSAHRDKCKVTKAGVKAEIILRWSQDLLNVDALLKFGAVERNIKLGATWFQETKFVMSLKNDEVPIWKS